MKELIDTLKDLWNDMNTYSISFKETMPFLNLKKYILIIVIYLVLLYFYNGWIFYILLSLFVMYLSILTLTIHAVKHFWILTLKNNDQLSANREYILLALKIVGGDILMHASEDLRSDREVVIKAIQSDPSAFEAISDELKQDRSFMLEVLKIDGEALRFMIDEPTDDRELVLEAIKNDPRAFEFASEALQNDVELKKIVGRI